MPTRSRCSAPSCTSRPRRLGEDVAQDAQAAASAAVAELAAEPLALGALSWERMGHAWARSAARYPYRKVPSSRGCSRTRSAATRHGGRSRGLVAPVAQHAASTPSRPISSDERHAHHGARARERRRRRQAPARARQGLRSRGCGARRTTSSPRMSASAGRDGAGPARRRSARGGYATDWRRGRRRGVERAASSSATTRPCGARTRRCARGWARSIRACKQGVVGLARVRASARRRAAARGAPRQEPDGRPRGRAARGDPRRRVFAVSRTPRRAREPIRRWKAAAKARCAEEGASTRPTSATRRPWLTALQRGALSLVGGPNLPVRADLERARRAVRRGRRADARGAPA